MKTNSTFHLLAAVLFTAMNLPAQVPNGGFENWTAGNPDNWTANNIATIAAPITQATPSYSGTYALKGDVVSSVAGNISAFLSSTDMSGNGFAVTQAYPTFSFYYKLHLDITAVVTVAVVMNDASGNPVGSGGQDYYGTVSSFTLANIPITYFGSNPVECIIYFAVGDTGTSTTPAVGNYFIIDALTLSTASGVKELTMANMHASVFPNPSSANTVVSLENALNGKAELLVYDSKGSVAKKLSKQMMNTKTFEWEFSVADLPNGIYAVRVVCGEKQWLTRIVKE